MPRLRPVGLFIVNRKERMGTWGGDGLLRGRERETSAEQYLQAAAGGRGVSGGVARTRAASRGSWGGGGGFRATRGAAEVVLRGGAATGGRKQ